MLGKTNEGRRNLGIKGKKQNTEQAMMIKSNNSSITHIQDVDSKSQSLMIQEAIEKYRGVLSPRNSSHIIDDAYVT